MFSVLFAVAALLNAGRARPSVNTLESDLALQNGSAEIRSEAMKRLLEVFGMEDPPHIRGLHKQAPQYMLDLYNTVADVDGVTKDPDLLQGNTVRSFFDKLNSKHIQFYFNLSNVAKSEKILTAELHLFKLKPQASLTFNRHHFCQVSIYQLLDSRKTNASHYRRLVSSRLLPIHSSGWEVFSITHSVQSWMATEGSNLGLMVTVRTIGTVGGSHVDSNLVRFASGRDHHQSKQPILVLFTDDGRRAASLENILKEPSGIPTPPGLSKEGHRDARSIDYEDEEQRVPCQRLPLYVDFEEIGWSGWIVSPRGYNAYHCKGSCPFPLGQNMRPTNHATVQSIINALKLSKGVETPCCVPNKLFSINLLYFDDEENVVLKQYDDMVAGSCGCH